MFETSEQLTRGMNQQIGNEMYASMKYVALGSYFAAEHLTQLSEFFFRQAEEERVHALKFVHFLLDIGAPVEIPAIPAPKSGIASTEEAVALALASEKEVTRQIQELMSIALEDKHRLAEGLLDWFMNEQLEEVNTMETLLKVVQRAGESGVLYVEEYLARTGGPAAEGGEA
jgi:ferritin